MFKLRRRLQWRCSDTGTRGERENGSLARMTFQSRPYKGLGSTVLAPAEVAIYVAPSGPTMRAARKQSAEWWWCRARCGLQQAAWGNELGRAAAEVTGRTPATAAMQRASVCVQEFAPGLPLRVRPSPWPSRVAPFPSPTARLRPRRSPSRRVSIPPALRNTHPL